MQPAICLLSVIPVRKEPSHRSEMVSQVLFGEYVFMGEKTEDFVRIKCLYDDYDGWVQASQLTPITEEQVLATQDFIGVHTEKVSVDWQCRMMPFSVPIYFPQTPGAPLHFGSRQVSYHVLESAVWKQAGKKFTEENLRKAVWMFLETPYLWGGKSVYGIDCSGFTQQVFKLFGVKLLRDAYLQAEQGKVVANIEESLPGDLAFFHSEAGRVTHVGIILNNREIVHASGKVRIDAIDSEGIIHAETGKRTHQLHSIRRFF